MTTVTVFQNYGRWVIEGQFDLSSAGAVTATRGDGITVVKNGTGLYDVTVAGTPALKLVEPLFADAAIQDAALGTVKDAGIKAISQTAGTDAVVITVRTVDAASADVDEATNTLTVGFTAVLRFLKMGNPL